MKYKMRLPRWLSAPVKAVDASGPVGGYQGNPAQAFGRLGMGPTMFNSLTGMGGMADRSSHHRFIDIYMTQWELETIYRSSWAAGKAINIPVDDMFTPGRLWMGDDEEAIDAMQMAEAELDVHKNLTGAMKAAPLYGTGLICILEKDKAPDTEFDPEMVSEGGIANLLAVDRFSCGVDAWVTDPQMPRYGQPFMYHITPRMGHHALIHVHHSRVLRFDGIASPLTEGWNSVERDWGVSKLNATINEIAREEAMHIGIDQLIQEASIHVVKIDGYKDAVKGKQDRDDPTIEELGTAVNLGKSLFRIMFADKSDETERVQVNFSGLPDLIERKAARLAAMFDIPVTRFLGQSPGGLNATGDSDTLNYAVRLESLRNRFMARDGRTLDTAVARHAGLSEAPECQWLPLMQVSPQQRAEIAAAQATAILDAVEKAVITEDEARERLGQIEDWFGELGALSMADLDDLRRTEPDPNAEPPGGPPNTEGNGPEA